MSKEEILKSEYSKLIANPDKVYGQNPCIIKAAHLAMEIYAIEKQLELLNELEGVLGQSQPFASTYIENMSFKLMDTTKELKKQLSNLTNGHD